MRLVVDERVGQPELRDRGLGDPRRQFLSRAQRVVHDLVEILADQMLRRPPVENRDRVVVPVDQRRAGAHLRRNPVGAVEAQHFLDEVDRALEVAAVTRDRDRPHQVTGGVVLAGDRKVQPVQGIAHLVVRDGKAHLGAHVVGRDLDLALPRFLATDLEHGAGNGPAGGFQDQIHGAARGIERAVRVHAAFEAVGGIRREPEAPRGPADGLRAEIRRLEHDVRGRGVHARVLAAHEAGDDERLHRVGDHQHAAVERALLLVEGHELLAVGRAADDKFAARDLLRIEHVQRLAELEHDVVADVDQVVDRAEAHRREAFLHPGGARADLHAGDGDADVKRAVLRRVDADALQEIGPGRAAGAVELDRGELQLVAQPGGQLAGHAEMAKRVGAVGRDFDIENRVAIRQGLVDRLADGRGGREDQQTRMIARQAEFIGGAHHPLGFVAVGLALGNLKAARQDRAGQRDRHAPAHVAIRRAAHDGAHAAVIRTDIHRAERDLLLEIRDLLAREDFAHDDIRQRRQAGVVDALDLEAEEGDGALQFFRGGVEPDILPEPVAGDFHGAEEFWCRGAAGRRPRASSSDAPAFDQANCFRKRRSFW